MRRPDRFAEASRWLFELVTGQWPYKSFRPDEPDSGWSALFSQPRSPVAERVIMSKLLAVFASLAAVAVVACSSADPSPVADSRAPVTPDASVAPAASDSGAVGCPGAPAGMTKAPSPVERCEGGYMAEDYPHSRTEAFLHSDGKTCLLGRSQVLHPMAA